METDLAYLAQGRLFYRRNGKSELIESHYGQEVVKRALDRQAKNEWKTGGTSTSALFSRQNLWGSGGDAPAIAVRISAVVKGKSGDELVYVLATDSVGGLFSYDINSKKETRIFHKEGLQLSDLSKQPGGELLVCSQRVPNGTARLATVRGNDVTEITEGDSVDEAPSWVAGSDKQIVFQSAGVARNKSGVMVGLGHSCIQKLDMGTGSLDVLLEDAAYDYLCPRMNKEGDLFYIRRPYEAPFKRSYPLHKQLLDIVLFPYRLARAIFHYLNFFSIAFSKKPLTTASGPKIEGMDEKALFLRGRMIDTERFLQEQGQKGETVSLVPNNWQLVRRSTDGKETVLADAVLSYDFDAGDSIIYSTGVAVFQIDGDGKNKKQLFRDKLVETIVTIV